MAEWQNLTWSIFHKISLYYDPFYKDYYIIFFDTFKKILPCEICRIHYTNYMNTYFYENIEKENLFNWTIDLHNHVNSSINKRLWTYDEAKEYHTNSNIDLKLFIYTYIRNIKKNVTNKDELISMIKTIPYIYKYNKKKELIKFSENFELTYDNLKDWLVAFIIIFNS